MSYPDKTTFTSRPKLLLNDDRCAVGQILPAGDHHPLARIKAAEDGVVVTRDLAQLQRPLMRNRLSIVVGRR